MFEHVTVLLSFVYALALTHVLSSATELIVARKHVKFSGLLAGWMLVSLTMLFGNWISVWSLKSVTDWSLGEIALQFVTAIGQYFVCSVVSIKVERGGPADMTTYFDAQRPLIFAALVLLNIIASIGNYLDRSTINQATSWVLADALDSSALVPLAIGGVINRKWAQWLALIATFALIGTFMATSL